MERKERGLPASASQVLGLKAWATAARPGVSLLKQPLSWAGGSDARL